ncbi:DUF551 domain-containing protein [Lelliottia amnigena]|uniref:DUF551 domain-containing protein n=1 Tax=Lelliottia amnigena TaxID=61646 RepID=UPI00195BCD13|nr:DUF551 domain-containing protein [Lelliottia amnigena]MBM7354490.1 hypothetical protein [Lelliottia amnigena]WSO20881.1 DUF551 domain-containing protein [Lelliottia amnigena]
MDWTSVKDGLPDSSDRFIVNTPEGIGTAGYNKFEKFGPVTLNGNVQYSQLEVTHWMPFPDAPGVYIEINADTRFDQAINGIESTFTLAELDMIASGTSVAEAAPDWQHRQPTGLRIPRPEVLGRGYLGNDMGHDYMYRYKDGGLSAKLPSIGEDN